MERRSSHACRLHPGSDYEPLNVIEASEMFLSLRFSPERADVVLAVLESISGMDHPLDI